MQGEKRAVLVVDDHQSFADTLALALATQDDLRCAGTASTVAKGLELAARARPDVVLLDHYLTDGEGVAAIPQFTEVCGARVIVLSGAPDIRLLADAARMGAAGFVSKDRSLADVLDAVRRCHDTPIFDRATLRSAMKRTLAAEPVRKLSFPFPSLTEREGEVLALLGEGLDTRAIAAMLGVSFHTTRGYIQTVLQKLGAHTQLEAVIIAAREGLLRLDRDG